MLASANGYYAPAAAAEMPHAATHTYPAASQPVQEPAPAQFQAAGHYYPEPQSTTMPPYASAAMQPYDAQVYSGADMKPTIETQLSAELQHPAPPPQPQSQPQPPQPTYTAFPVQNGYQAVAPQAGPAAWRDFTEGVMGNLPSGSEYAHTLMALQNHAHTNKDGTPDLQTATTMNMAALGGMQMPAQEAGHLQQAWPFIHFGPSGGVAPGG